MNLDPIFRLFEGLPRKGPGSLASTRRALAAIADLPARPRILDIGCGAGPQTLALAAETGGHVTAVDIHAPYLDELRQAARNAGLKDRVTALRQSMDALELPAQHFDLIWSEGAVFVLGVRKALALWRPLLKPGGHLAFTDCAWLVPEPAAEVRDYWREAYPDMDNVPALCRRAETAGFRVRHHFTLPASDWTESFFPPLKARIAETKRRRPLDPGLSAAIRECEHEMALYARHGETFGYVFLILRRTD